MSSSTEILGFQALMPRLFEEGIILSSPLGQRIEQFVFGGLSEVFAFDRNPEVTHYLLEKSFSLPLCLQDRDDAISVFRDRLLAMIADLETKFGTPDNKKLLNSIKEKISSLSVYQKEELSFLPPEDSEYANHDVAEDLKPYAEVMLSFAKIQFFIHKSKMFAVLQQNHFKDFQPNPNHSVSPEEERENVYTFIEEKFAGLTVHERRRFYFLYQHLTKTGLEQAIQFLRSYERIQGSAFELVPEIFKDFTRYFSQLVKTHKHFSNREIIKKISVETKKDIRDYIISIEKIQDWMLNEGTTIYEDIVLLGEILLYLEFSNESTLRKILKDAPNTSSLKKLFKEKISQLITLGSNPGAIKNRIEEILQNPSCSITPIKRAHSIPLRRYFININKTTRLFASYVSEIQRVPLPSLLDVYDRYILGITPVLTDEITEVSPHSLQEDPTEVESEEEPEAVAGPAVIPPYSFIQETEKFADDLEGVLKSRTSIANENALTNLKQFCTLLNQYTTALEQGRPINLFTYATHLLISGTLLIEQILTDLNPSIRSHNLLDLLPKDNTLSLDQRITLEGINRSEIHARSITSFATDWRKKGLGKRILARAMLSQDVQKDLHFLIGQIFTIAMQLTNSSSKGDIDTFLKNLSETKPLITKPCINLIDVPNPHNNPYLENLNSSLLPLLSSELSLALESNLEDGFVHYTNAMRLIHWSLEETLAFAYEKKTRTIMDRSHHNLIIIADELDIDLSEQEKELFAQGADIRSITRYAAGAYARTEGGQAVEKLSRAQKKRAKRKGVKVTGAPSTEFQEVQSKDTIDWRRQQEVLQRNVTILERFINRIIHLK